MRWRGGLQVGWEEAQNGVLGKSKTKNLIPRVEQSFHLGFRENAVYHPTEIKWSAINLKTSLMNVNQV